MPSVSSCEGRRHLRQKSWVPEALRQDEVTEAETRMGCCQERQEGPALELLFAFELQMVAHPDG